MGTPLADLLEVLFTLAEIFVSVNLRNWGRNNKCATLLRFQHSLQMPAELNQYFFTVKINVTLFSIWHSNLRNQF